MKNRLIIAIVFVFLSSGAAFAQKTTIIKAAQPIEKKNSVCANFPMPTTEVKIDDEKLPIVNIFSEIDFKLIIIDPCVSKDAETPSSFVLPDEQ